MRYRFFHISFLIVALMLTVTSVHAQESLFEKYEDTNGVTTIYISKTMLGMIPDVKAGKHDIRNIAGKLDYLRILSCEKQALIAPLLEDAKKVFRSGGYEPIMKVNEDGDKVTIYQRTLKGGKNEFSLLTEEKNEITIINIVGTVTLKEIQGLTSH